MLSLYDVTDFIGREYCHVYVYSSVNMWLFVLRATTQFATWLQVEIMLAILLMRGCYHASVNMWLFILCYELPHISLYGYKLRLCSSPYCWGMLSCLYPCYVNVTVYFVLWAPIHFVMAAGWDYVPDCTVRGYCSVYVLASVNLNVLRATTPYVTWLSIFVTLLILMRVMSWCLY